MHFDDMKETTLSREDIYDGRIVQLHVDKVRLPNGRTSTREIVEHCHGVGVLALDENGDVFIVEQYRYAFSTSILEIPAGKLDPGEDHRAGGLRELKEETGIIPGSFVYLGETILSPGCFTEVIHMYLATDLHYEAQKLDEDEFLNVHRIPFEELLRRCTTGEITDAKTMLAALLTKEYLERKEKSHG